MHSKSFRSKFGVALTLAAAACTANAALVMVTTEADFASIPRLTALATDSFDDLPPAFAASPLTRTVGAYTYSANAGGGLYGAGVGSDGWLSTNLSGDTLLLNAFGGGVSAIGGHFFGSDIAGAFEAGNDILLTVSDSLGDTMSETISSASLSSFRGFATDGTLVSLMISIASTGSFATVNDLQVGRIPEPASLALVLAALVGVAGATNRRQHRAADVPEQAACAS